MMELMELIGITMANMFSLRLGYNSNWYAHPSCSTFLGNELQHLGRWQENHKNGKFFVGSPVKTCESGAEAAIDWGLDIKISVHQLVRYSTTSSCGKVY